MELTINRLIELLDQNKYLCLKDLEVFLTNNKK